MKHYFQDRPLLQWYIALVVTLEFVVVLVKAV